jgi:hypothetical protein
MSRGNVHGWESAQGVLTTLDACAGLTADGLLPLPVVVSLTLTGVRGTRLQPRPSHSHLGPHELDVDVAALTPTVLHAWDETAAQQIRAVFDEMSQAWGLPHDPNYRDGQRIWFDDRQRVNAPSPAYWGAGWQAAY